MSDISILSLSHSPWSHPFWTSRQFLTYELARHARVLYTTERGSLRGALRPSSWFGSAPAAPFPAPDGLVLLDARWPRVYRYPRLERLLDRLHVGHLQKNLDAGRPARRVVYAWNPSFIDVVEGLDYDTLVYHPYDMFRHFVDSASDLVRQEEAMCGLADAVVTPHRQVAEALGHPNTHVINNGVFLPAFPDPRTLAHPEILNEIEGPIIGYIGAINDKLDFQLLLDVFSAEPDWQLAVVGFEGPGDWKESAAYRGLQALPNVHLLGSVPIDRAAEVIAGFDVGIIPYSLSGWAQYSESPLKLYQYWAMGVPVVCTPLPNVVTRPGALEVRESAEDWRAGIEAQLRVRGDDARTELRGLAGENDWSAKARQVLEIVGG